MHHTPINICTFSDWYQEWSTYARHSQVDETTKMWAFQNNLPQALNQKILRISLQPTTLVDLVKKAQEFNCNWQIYGESAT